MRRYTPQEHRVVQLTLVGNAAYMYYGALAFADHDYVMYMGKVVVNSCLQAMQGGMCEEE